MKELSNFCPIYAAPGKKDALREALKKLAAQTRQEVGNVCYRLHEASDVANLFMIYEQWRDQAALDYHMQQKYLVDFLADKEGLLAQEICGTMCAEIK